MLEIVAAAICSASVLGCYWTCYRDRDDAMSISLFFMVLVFVIRPWMLASGYFAPLDPLVGSDLATPSIRAAFLVFLWCVCFCVGAIFFHRLAEPLGSLLPAPRRDVPMGYYFTIASVLGLGSAITAATFLRRFGSIGAVIKAAKLDKELAGTYVIKLIPSVGAVLATALIIWCIRDWLANGAIAQRRFAYLLGSTGVLAVCLLASLCWGTRAIFGCSSVVFLFGWSTQIKRIPTPLLCVGIAAMFASLLVLSS